ncbi:MAG TPA: hydroxymethylbilane synthase [Smithella sp.]|nr:hydroxymethylbilane synthase [Smithella sp.]HNY49738.1 hydroxymethylbilane synthase [Smithella sp.]HOG90828.1 hydroxymethylbilane synthase [Smithella sp.]HQH16127.1 hydroxymethylbilane synthase [Smithella sp.]
MNLKIGTRGSKLALTQTNFVADKLKKAIPDADIEICVIKTSGDIMQDVSLLTIGGQGVFVKELEEALLSDKIDLAVHSMKDVPGDIPEGLTFAAILPREDVRDVLVSRNNIKMEFLPKGAKVGTGSQRRGAQIKAVMPDVNIVPLRGNLDTRLKKIETENLTGVILAAAGMKRMGLAERITQFLPVETMLPAVGQGALGVQIRKDDAELAKACAELNDVTTAAEVTAERAFLRALGGGCRLPIAALGKLDGQMLTLEGMLAAPNGTTMIREKMSGTIKDAEAMGKKLAEIILDKGGRRLMDLMR